MSMQQWLSLLSRGHLHQSGNGHHPSLLPIFDQLFQSDLRVVCTRAQNDNDIPESFDTLLTARIIRFANNSGTAVTVNVNHVCWERIQQIVCDWQHVGGEHANDFNLEHHASIVQRYLVQV